MKFLSFTALLLYLFLMSIRVIAEDISTSMRMLDRLIGINVSVNGIEGFLIFDTGAEGLVLNSKYFEGKEAGHYRCISATQSNLPTQTTFADVIIGHTEWKNRSAFVLPLTYLETGEEVKVLGLIGGKFFIKYKVMLNFHDMRFELLPAVRRKNQALYLSNINSNLIILPFNWKGDMPWISAHIEGQSLKLGLDTGAEINFLDKKKWSSLQAYLFNFESGYYRTVSRKISKTKAARLRNLQFGELLCFPMRTMAMDMLNINSQIPGANLDGLLGYEFLKQFSKVTIDFKNRLLWMEQYESEQYMLLTLDRE